MTPDKSASLISALLLTVIPLCACSSQKPHIENDTDTALTPVDETVMRTTVKELASRADCITDCDEAILDIVLKCAEPYFAGAKTAETTASEIQSKVSIYLAEQYG